MPFRAPLPAPPPPSSPSHRCWLFASFGRDAGTGRVQRLARAAGLAHRLGGVRSAAPVPAVPRQTPSVQTRLWTRWRGRRHDVIYSYGIYRSDQKRGMAYIVMAQTRLRMAPARAQPRYARGCLRARPPEHVGGYRACTGVHARMSSRARAPTRACACAGIVRLYVRARARMRSRVLARAYARREGAYARTQPRRGRKADGSSCIRPRRGFRCIRCAPRRHILVMTY